MDENGTKDSKGFSTMSSSYANTSTAAGSPEGSVKPAAPQKLVQPSPSGDKVANYLTMVGHACSDINQGALSAVLPFLVATGSYSYFDVTMLILAANIASAVIQPLFGWMGDKHPRPWFMALGVFLAGVGMCGIGFFTEFWMIVCSAMVCGVGVAMFHPEGGRLANLAAGVRKAGGMSIFAVGGNIGFFVGPILCAAFLTAFGMHGTLVFLFPATACAIVLLSFNGRFKALGTSRKATGDAAEKPEQWGKFCLMMGVLSVRSVLSYGLMSFIPLFVMSVIGQPEAISSLTLSIFSVAGAAATILSGRASEKFGPHKLMVVCFALTAVFTVFFALNRSFAAAIVFAMLLAVVSDLCYPSSVALGMSYVPRHLGMASGFSYGIAVCVGGVAEPFLGMAGDSIGLPAVMLIIAALAAVATVLSLVVKHVDNA